MADEPTAGAPETNGEIFISRNNQTHGPYPRDVIENWINTGKINRHDLACTDATPWQPVAKLLWPDQFATATSGLSGKQWGIIIAAILGFIVLAAVVNSLEKKPDASAAAPAKPEPPRINAIVAYDRNGIIITNGDHQRPLRSVEMKLNMKQWGEDNGHAFAGDVRPGKTVTVPYSQFLDKDLHRFNIATTAVLTVFVKAQIEPGEESVALFLCPGQICQRAPDK